MADIENIYFPLHIVIYSSSSLGQYFFTAISLLTINMIHETAQVQPYRTLSRHPETFRPAMWRCVQQGRVLLSTKELVFSEFPTPTKISVG